MAQIATSAASRSLPARGRMRRDQKISLAGLITVTLLLCILWYMGVFGGNIHTVIPGKVYRSAQLTGHNLAEVLDSDHIKTVINLRGGTVSDSFYRSEVTECRERGIKHVDIPMSARFLPPPRRLEQILYTFDHGPYPVLVHCQGGADRTGLTSTLYLNLYQHVPLDDAEHRQLTWRYAHISFGTAHAMDDFFNMYRGSSHGEDLRAWIHNRYPALYAHSPEALPEKTADMDASKPDPTVPVAPDSTQAPPK